MKLVADRFNTEENTALPCGLGRSGGHCDQRQQRQQDEHIPKGPNTSVSGDNGAIALRKATQITTTFTDYLRIWAYCWETLF